MCSSSNFTSLESWPWPSALTFCETFPVKSWSGEMDVYRKPDEYLGGLGGMVSSKNAPILIDEFSCWATLSSNLLIIWCKGFPRLTFSSSPLSLKTRCTAASSRHFWRMRTFSCLGVGASSSLNSISSFAGPVVVIFDTIPFIFMFNIHFWFLRLSL